MQKLQQELCSASALFSASINFCKAAQSKMEREEKKKRRNTNNDTPPRGQTPQEQIPEPRLLHGWLPRVAFPLLHGPCTTAQPAAWRKVKQVTAVPRSPYAPGCKCCKILGISQTYGTQQVLCTRFLPLFKDPAPPNLAHTSFTPTSAMTGSASQPVDLFLSLVGSREGWWKVDLFYCSSSM